MGNRKINYSMIKSFSPPKIKTIPIRFNFDTDRDGVPDWRDCRPFDPMRHQISKNENEKLRKVEKMYRLIEQHKKEIAEEHPESASDIYSGYSTKHPTDLDPLVQPVVDVIYQKDAPQQVLVKEEKVTAYIHLLI